jgi:zinc D-Ala-D-Ala carboxypeptidase
VSVLPLGGIAIGVGLFLAGITTFLVTTSRDRSTPTPIVSPSVGTTVAPATAPSLPQENTDNVLNHLPYLEAPDAELVSIGGGYRLRNFKQWYRRLDLVV